MSTITIEDVREAARRSYGPTCLVRATPTRMGYAAQRLGAPISINPYPPGSLGHHSFVQAFLFKCEHSAEAQS